MSRLYLSPPHLSGGEWGLVRDALDSNWVAPLGPHVDAFESEFAALVDVPHCVALASGTAALHLALTLLDIGPGDEVICPSLTFVASANAIRYCGAKPMFIDSDAATWTLDPTLLHRELETAASRGQLPAAVVSVDLYGQCADYQRIREACDCYGVPIVEDAAEALGSTYRDRPAGGFGRTGVFSFNGNKIVTTSGGGMLVSEDEGLVDRARFLASQARDEAPHYEHSELGYNYRLSNLLAAVGRAQIRMLGDRVASKRRIFAAYHELLGDLPGISFMPEAPFGRSNRWLTCLTVDSAVFGCDRETIRLALEKENIEARPVWKPMHLQPLYAGCRMVDQGVASHLFERGLCLPSGTAMSEQDVDRVAGIIRHLHESAGR